jgi:hypothetical protein
MIPLSTPIFDSRNNKFYFRETTSGSILTATLTSGNYIASGTNANSIATQLKSALESASTLTWTYTVSVNSINNIITISTTNGNFSITSGVNDCYYELGFNTDNLNSFNSSHIGNETIDLSGVKIIHISSSIQAIKVFSKQFNLIASIPCQEQQNEISVFDDQSSDYILSPIKSLNTIRFSFYDDRFRRLTLLKDYSLTINFLCDV